MAVNPQISLLLDIYGSMLTPKERDALELYYNEDLSLREIADNERTERASRMEEGERATISRQGVRDAIKRAEAKLFDMEERLELAKKTAARRRELTVLADNARRIRESNARHGKLSDIDTLSAEIIELAEKLSEI